MTTTLINNATIVNEGKTFVGSVLIENNKISKVIEGKATVEADKIIDATGKYLFPGCIDDQVHFREPGLPKPKLR
jgi:dihydroorotase